MDWSIVIIYVGIVLIGATAALVGTFTFLQKKALLGDAISHSILPGIVLAYMTAGERKAEVLLVGAVLSGWFATQLISWLQRKTPLKQDTVIAATLSIFFSLGLSLLSFIQGRPDDGQAGLSDFLFGKIAAINVTDLYLFLGITLLVCVVVYLRSRILFGFAFNPEYMKSRGYSLNKHDLVMNVLTILVVAMGVQAVGVVLMSALLIVPVVIARLLVDRMQQMLILAVIFGVLSATLGAYLSTLGPGIPTGPCIILVLSCFVVVAIFVRKRRQQSRTIKNLKSYE